MALDGLPNALRRIHELEGRWEDLTSKQLKGWMDSANTGKKKPGSKINTEFEGIVLSKIMFFYAESVIATEQTAQQGSSTAKKVLFSILYNQGILQRAIQETKIEWKVSEY